MIYGDYFCYHYMNCIHSYDYEVKCLLELRKKTKYGGAVAYILSPSNKLFGNFFFGKVMLETILLAAISLYISMYPHINIHIHQPKPFRQVDVTEYAIYINVGHENVEMCVI